MPATRTSIVSVFVFLAAHAVFSTMTAPRGSEAVQFMRTQRSAQGIAQEAASPPPRFSYTEADRNRYISDLNRMNRSRPDHPFSELNQLSYHELINLLVTIDAYDIPGLFTFTPDSYTFYKDQNRMLAIIDAIGDRGSRFTPSDHLGIPTLVEVLRAGFFLGFYNKELDYLSNQKPFIQNILPAQEKIAGNANFSLGTATQDKVVNAMGSLMGIGKTNKAVVLKLVPLMKQFNDNFAAWAANYNKSTAWWGIGNGVDYALVAVDLYANPTVSAHPCYNGIDAYWDEVAKSAEFGTLNGNITWAINNAVWWTGRIGQFVVKPRQVNVLLAVIDLYGKWEQPSVEAIKVLDLYYKNDHPYDINQVKKEVHDKLLPNYYRFDNGTIIFNVGSAVPLTRVKTLYWAIKEVKAQFHRYAGRDEPIEQGHPDDSLIARVYSSPDDYTYNNFLYGLSTANGGMYIESWGTFFTYERTPQQSIYTLEDLFRHEYVHFLQSRYYTPGFWGGPLWNNDRLTWFEEGGAEFTAGASRDKKILYRKTMAKNISSSPSGRMTLPQVLKATYAGGFTFYTYACVFFSYMYEHRMDILTRLIGFVKTNNAAGYDSYVSQLINDAALGIAYNNYMQQLVNNANNFADPATSPDYTADIPQGSIAGITSDIKTATGMNSVAVRIDSSSYYHTYLISGTYTGTSGFSELEAWKAMNDTADSFLDKLDDNPWAGYKTVTAYFSNYTTSGGNYQYKLSFRGILKKVDTVSIMTGNTFKGESFYPVFQNPGKAGSPIMITIPAGNPARNMSVEIFNLSGKQLASLPVSETGHAQWNATTSGTSISKGFYLVSLRSGERTVTRPLLLQ